MANEALQAVVYRLLTTDPSLTAVVPAERWFNRGNVVDSPAKPFVVLAWLGTLTTSGLSTPELLDVYVHDEVGSYLRIREMLGNPARPGGVYARLSAAQQYQPFSTGARLTQADYLGRSGELVDDDRRTGVMFSSWKIIGGQY